MRSASHITTGPSILWASILASAAVAAFTTLIIEYLAKPWLEARKERILEHSRRHRTALHDLASVLFSAGRIVGLRDEQSVIGLRERTIQIARDTEKLIEAIYEEVDIPASLDDDWSNTTAAVLSFLIGIQVVEHTHPDAWNRFDSAGNHLGLYYDLLSAPRWHWWRRRRFVREIKSSALPEP